MISVYDNVMNVIFYHDLPLNEENPFASWLIAKVGVAGLVQIKSYSTILAVSIMLLLAKTKYRVVILPVFIFQLFLFCYLTFYTVQGQTVFTGDWSRPIRLFFEFYQGKHMP